MDKNPETRNNLADLCMNERELKFIEPVPENEINTKACHYIPPVLVVKIVVLHP